MEQKTSIALFLFFFTLFGLVTSSAYGTENNSSPEFSNMLLPSSASFLSKSDTDGPNKKDPLLPIILNIIPGFGIGSFVLGDVWGGVIGVAGELTGIGLIIAGAVFFYYDLVNITLNALVGNRKEDISTGFIMALCGGILYGGTKIFGIIKPICFADEYNKRNPADGTKQLSLSVGPFFSSPADGRGIPLHTGIQAKLAY